MKKKVLVGAAVLILAVNVLLTLAAHALMREFKAPAAEQRQTLLVENDGLGQVAVYVDGFRAATLLPTETKCIKLQVNVRTLGYRPQAERMQEIVLVESLNDHAWRWTYTSNPIADAVGLTQVRSHCRG